MHGLRVGIAAALILAWCSSAAFAQPFGEDPRLQLLRAARDKLLGQLPQLLEQSRSSESEVRDKANGQLRALATLMLPDTALPNAPATQVDGVFRTVERIGAPALDPLAKFIESTGRTADEALRLFGPGGPVADLQRVRQKAIDSRARIAKAAEAKQADPPKDAPPEGAPHGKDEGGAKPAPDDNPNASAKVGDWIRYQHTDPVGNLVIHWEETRVVVDVDDKAVKIKRTSKHSTGKVEEETLTIDRAKPLPLARLLDYGLDQKVVIMSMKEGREKLMVGGRELDTRWTEYQISTPGFAGSSELKVWRSAEAPLSGIVRTEQDSGFGNKKLVTEAVEFGTGKQPAAPKVGSKDKKEAPLGVKFVRVPAGAFDMGAIPMQDFKKRFNDVQGDEEKTFLLLADTPPIRRVKIAKGFEIGAHEVTIGQFRAFVKDTGHVTDAEKDREGGTGRLPDGGFGQDPKFTWKEYGFRVTDDHPVANVSWNDAVAFCEWLGTREKRRCRLPTEAEWEYACRAGAKTRFAHGDAPAGLVKVGNLADQSLLKQVPGVPWALKGNDGFAFTAPVGSFPPNAFGLCDMHGNVLEWCSDRFSFSDPVRGLVKLPPEKETLHVHRGGNWFNDPATAGCACRSGSPPNFRNSLTGFRVVRELDDADDR